MFFNVFFIFTSMFFYNYELMCVSDSEICELQ